MKREEIWYMTDGKYNYGEYRSLEECNAAIAEQVNNDKELQQFWIDKCGYVPNDVDIPMSYYATQQRWN